MGAADNLLFALLALADFCLLFHLHRRRQRRRRSQKMMRSLRIAIQREARRAGRKASSLVLQQPFLTA